MTDYGLLLYIIRTTMGLHKNKVIKVFFPSPYTNVTFSVAAQAGSLTLVV